MSGGSNGGMEAYLPMALAIGATIATGGAAAPTLGAALGAEGVGAAVLGSGLIGAGTGGLSAALTGGDVGRGALMGGLGGAATGGIGSAFGGGTPGLSEVPTTDISSPITSSMQSGNGLITNPNAGLTALNPSGPTLSESGLFNPETNLSALPSGAPASLTPTIDSSLASEIPKGGITPTIDKYGSFPAPSSTGGWSDLSGMQKAGIVGAGTLGLTKLLGQQSTITPQEKQGVPAGLDFKFDRNTYQPAVAPYYGGIASNYPQTPYAQRLQGYADGGEINTVEEMSRQNSLGNNQMFPQSGIGGLTGANTYQNATNTPTPNNVLEPTDAITDPYTGAMKMARGGIASPTSPTQNSADTQQGAYDLNAIRQYMEAGKTTEGYKQLSVLASRGDDNAIEALNNLKNQAPGTAYEAPVQAAQGGIMGYAGGGTPSLGSYSDGGRMLKGPGDGMSDDIPAKIGKHQPARLADGEFVVPADVVSHLGNGSTDAGAKQLYAMMNKVRKARTGRKAQGKQIKPEKYLTV
jgi:hypothetical protein